MLLYVLVIPNPEAITLLCSLLLSFSEPSPSPLGHVARTACSTEAVSTSRGYTCMQWFLFVLHSFPNKVQEFVPLFELLPSTEAVSEEQLLYLCDLFWVVMVILESISVCKNDLIFFPWVSPHISYYKFNLQFYHSITKWLQCGKQGMKLSILSFETALIWRNNSELSESEQIREHQRRPLLCQISSRGVRSCCLISDCLL